VARLGTTTTTSTASSAAGQRGILYASCMRAHGVSNFPDPLPGGGFDVPKGDKREPGFQSAFGDCEEDLPNASPPAKHVNLGEEVSFARCMRSDGISDFPDPTAAGTWNLPDTLTTDSARFEAAARACQTTGDSLERTPVSIARVPPQNRTRGQAGTPAPPQARSLEATRFGR
jgi:hypothetical protein